MLTGSAGLPPTARRTGAAQLLEQIDIYCERTGPQFWSEPVNALTNAAFLVAAVLLFIRWRHGRRRGIDLALPALVLVIGIGSFLFHTFATRWAALADVIPIAVFIHVAFFLSLRRFFGLGRGPALAATVGFFVFGFGVEQVGRPLIGGSAGYVPGLLAIAGIAALLWRRDDPTWQPLAGAFLLFFVSLSWRTVDGAACAAFPLGTHFLWHVLNACVLYVLSRTLMGRPGGEPQR